MNVRVNRTNDVQMKQNQNTETTKQQQQPNNNETLIIIYGRGVDNTRINMKLHTFYGLVQCAEIKCSLYSTRLCFCVYENDCPYCKAYCI